jgi:hypothetical protein
MTDTFTQDHANATAQAVTAVTQFFNETLNGQDRPMCGFGWVAFYPANKGNTKLGMSNPGRYRGQNVDAQYAGAAAYAGRMSKETGMTFVAREALD